MMSEQPELYENFNGYNAYPLNESEKIIRQRLCNRFQELLDRIEHCEQESRDKRMIKILEKILVIKKRMSRMKKEMENRSQIFMTEQMKARITTVDEESLKDIDYRVAELIAESMTIMEALTCAEKDTHIIEKFSAIDGNMRELENRCHQRTRIMKEEKL